MFVCNAGSWGSSPGLLDELLNFLCVKINGVLAKILIYSVCILRESNLIDLRDWKSVF